MGDICIVGVWSTEFVTTTQSCTDELEPIPYKINVCTFSQWLLCIRNKNTEMMGHFHVLMYTFMYKVMREKSLYFEN
jgi:hypothetical protein